MSNPNYRFLMQQVKQSKPAKRWLFIAISLGIISGLLIITQSALLAFILDRIYLHDYTRSILASPLCLFLSIIIIRAGISWLREVVAFHTANTVKETIRKNIMGEIMQQSPIALATFKTGALTSTLLEQTEALHGFFADYLPQMVIAVALPCLILVFVFIQNWISGLILLFTAPLIPLFMALIGMGTARLNQENFQTLSRMSAYFLDMLQGLTTLTLFHRAESQVIGIEKISTAFREKTMRILRIAFLSSSALELFATLSIAIIAVYLGLGLLGFIHVGFSKPISLQHALFVLLLAPEFFMPLRQLGTFYHARSEAVGAAEEILKIMPTITKPHENKKIVIDKNIVLTFENINFSYDKRKKIITDFNLTLPFGDCIAITGPSGSGKSTLLHLIAKFITPLDGKIFANSIDLNTLTDDSWREHIALLHQNTRLFHGTIEDNIRFAKPTATADEITYAAEKSGTLDFSLQLPQGLNTLINENNGGLSGGQVQRVALARIILKDSPIVLLDEPTAFLDAANVKVIMELLQTWRDKKTVIIATHDISMIRTAKRVYAL